MRPLCDSLTRQWLLIRGKGHQNLLLQASKGVQCQGENLLLAKCGSIYLCYPPEPSALKSKTFQWARTLQAWNKPTFEHGLNTQASSLRIHMFLLSSPNLPEARQVTESHPRGWKKKRPCAGLWCCPPFPSAFFWGGPSPPGAPSASREKGWKGRRATSQACTRPCLHAAA